MTQLNFCLTELSFQFSHKGYLALLISNLPWMSVPILLVLYDVKEKQKGVKVSLSSFDRLPSIDIFKKSFNSTMMAVGSIRDKSG